MTTDRSTKKAPAKHSAFENRLWVKLFSGCSVLSVATGSMSRLCVFNYRKLACFRKQRSNRKYQNVGPFLNTFHIQHAHSKNFFMSKTSLLFLRDMTWFFGTAAAVRDNNHWKVVPVMLNMELKFKGTARVVILAQRRFHVFKQGYKSVEVFAYPCKHVDRDGSTWISWRYLITKWYRTWNVSCCLCYLKKRVLKEEPAGVYGTISSLLS